MCKILILVNYIFCYPFGLIANVSFSGTDSLSKQVQALEQGEQVPDLKFISLVNAKKQSLKLSDFKGKLIILDFWATWCSSCVAALPKLNELQKKFQDKIQIIGVTDQKVELIETFYKQRVEIQNLNLVFPTETDDNVLANYFPHQTISHLVWISEDRKVIAITESNELTEENITKILERKVVNLKPKIDRNTRNDINIDEPFFLEKVAKPIYVNESVTDGGIRYKTIITKKVPGLTSIIKTFTGRVIATNTILENLFKSAYKYDNLASGEYLTPFPNNKLKWEVGINTFYDVPKENDLMQEFYAENQFCFELVFYDYYNGPKYDWTKLELNTIISNIMKKELQLWTGFYSAIIPREENTNVLKIKDKTKICSEEIYSKSENVPGNLGITLKDSRMLNLKKALWYSLQLDDPLIDETNYYGPINMRLDCKMTNFEEVQNALLKFGIELKKEKRIVPVLVVRSDVDF
ncbi:TlpA family protein disulfide reductase [Sphingobacterium sp. MYb388]|uniref:TlpA family protein disulfide reductase n=1 Tax=Sphingobacterium sp. MYb388 TaxID=2745437 RepID=UPI0030A98CEB